jgi:hypothetical protein
MPAGKKSAAKREEVALALAVGASVRSAAQHCGVAERTIQNWRAEADFAARVDRLRAELTERAMGNLVARMVGAADTLGKLLEDEDPRVRLGACRTLLEQAVRLRQVVTFEDYLRVLEEREKERQEREKFA